MVFNVAIAGISSKLAVLIAEELLERPDVHLRGSSRDIIKLSQTLKDDSRVSLIETGPFDKETLESLVKGCDVVICCYLADNETMTEGQKVLIDLCEEHRVPRYVASDYTADYTKLNYGDVIIKDPMKDVKAYLETKSNVKGVHVFIGLLLETYWMYFSNWNPGEKSLSYWGSADDKWEITTYRTCAQYVAALTVDSDAVGIFSFLGDRYSTNDIANNFNAVYGFRPSLKNLGSLTDLYEQVGGTGPQQNAFAAGQWNMLAGKWPVSGKDNKRYPEIKPETAQDFFEKNDIMGIKA